MPISHKNKLIFIHIPKNAGTSITDSEGMNFSFKGHHLPSFYKSNFPNQWENYIKFCVIRNPWDRVVSNYEYARMPESHWHSVSGNSIYGAHPDYKNLIKLNFKETLQAFKEDNNFLKHQGWESQNKYIYNNEGLMLLDYVFKLEDIELDLKFKKIIPNLSVKNVSKKSYKKYKDYYDNETKDIVSEIYAKDIELFKFKF